MSQANIDLLWKTIRDPKLRTIIDHLGIEFEAIAKEGISATMPVDGRTVQYFGLLHGGANVVLAETLASVGALVHVDPEHEMVVGLEINANHLHSAVQGRVRGTGKPIHVGRRTQVWAMEIHNEEGRLCCVSRCTIAVVPRVPRT